MFFRPNNTLLLASTKPKSTYKSLELTTATHLPTKGVHKWEWLNPFELEILQNFITCAKGINCFRILFACLIVDVMQIPRNEFACKFQGTLLMGPKVA